MTYQIQCQDDYEYECYTHTHSHYELSFILSWNWFIWSIWLSICL